MIAEAHGWNAISDNPELVAQAEQHERDGTGYRVGYGEDGFGVTVTEPESTEPEEPQDLTVRFDDQAGHYRATRDGELVAFAKWSGSVLRVYLPGGTFIGRMYRSDGKIIAGETVYTYRAETGTDPLQFVGGERQVARGETMSDAMGLLLAAVANARRETGPFRIGGQPACGAPVDGGRCGRAPGHEGHPHIKEPGTEPRLFTSITRAQLNTRWGWVGMYSYTSPVRQEHTRGDGAPYVIEQGQPVAHGTALTGLRSMLRRRWGRQLQTTEAWKP